MKHGGKVMGDFKSGNNNPSFVDPDTNSINGAGDNISPNEIVSNAHSITPLVLETISFATNIRADIVCQQSIDRPCGYLIRPQIWFLKLTKPVHDRLISLGLNPQKRYTVAGDITKIIYSMRGLESLLANPLGFELVKALNGILRQPKNHREVIEALDLIENSIESL